MESSTTVAVVREILQFFEKTSVTHSNSARRPREATCIWRSTWLSCSDSEAYDVCKAMIEPFICTISEGLLLSVRKHIGGSYQKMPVAVSLSECLNECYLCQIVLGLS